MDKEKGEEGEGCGASIVEMTGEGERVPVFISEVADWEW